jgi:hypothetical protein
MRRWLAKLTTSADNRSPCIVRITLLIGFVALLIGVFTRPHFPCLEFAQGCSFLIGSAGASMWLKKDSDPPVPHSEGNIS